MMTLTKCITLGCFLLALGNPAQDPEQRKVLVGYESPVVLNTNIQVTLDDEKRPSHTIKWKYLPKYRGKVLILSNGSALVFASGCKDQNLVFLAEVTDWDKRTIDSVEFLVTVKEVRSDPPVIDDPKKPPSDKEDDEEQDALYKLGIKTYNEVTHKTKKEVAKKLADSFAEVAKTLEEGNFTSLQAMMEQIQVIMGENLTDTERQAWEPLRAGIENELNAGHQSGELVTLKDFIPVWKSLSKALNDCIGGN